MWVTAYSDASFKHGKGSWGIWLRSEQGRLVKAGTCPEWVDTNTTAEMCAGYVALFLAHRTWPKMTHLCLNSDCQATVGYLATKCTQEPSRESMRRIQKLVRDFCAGHGRIYIRTKHVKGHMRGDDVRTYLNHQVDRIAGDGKSRRVDSVTLLSPARSRNTAPAPVRD
jgi:ribonuclease HI